MITSLRSLFVEKKPFIEYGLYLIALLLIGYVIYSFGNTLGFLLFGAASGIIILFVSFTNKYIGLYTALIFSTFAPFLGRYLMTNLHIGVVIDGIIGVTILGVFIRKDVNKLPNERFFSNPIHILFLLLILFTLVEGLNPNGTLEGWLFGLRLMWTTFLAYFLFIAMFDNYKSVSTFTKIWLALFGISALYAFYQEYVGLPWWDLNWLTANETRIDLNYINGRWRKFSFFFSVSVFGMAMAFGAIFSIIMATGPFSKRYRVLLLLGAFLMLMAMVFSGTRTGYAMVPIGLLFFMLMTLNDKRTLVIAILGLMSIAIIVFGPFYGGFFGRIKSAFRPNEDASMNVREMNREIIQPYIYEHPFGGGVNTCGSEGNDHAPDHRLAGFPPDSWYLKQALEMGWFGLIIYLALYGSVVILGVINFYKCKHPKIRVYYLAYLSSFFALTIAGFTQTSINQFPLLFIFFATFVIIPRMHLFEKVDYDFRKKEGIEDDQGLSK